MYSELKFNLELNSSVSYTVNMVKRFVTCDVFHLLHHMPTICQLQIKIEKHKQEILAVTSTALKKNLIGTD